jgi:hypothetical protein
MELRFNVSQLKYLETTVTDQNMIQEEIKRRLNFGNACYHSVQNLMSSRLLSKNVKIRIYRTIILPVVLYGCEAWSLILREKHKLRVFENRVLRIFGPKLDEVMRGWKKVRNEESRRMRWAGHVPQMREKRNVHKLLLGKPEGKRPLRRPRHGWRDDIKMDLLRDRIGWCGLDWSGSGLVQVESSCECSNEPSSSIKCWETTEWLYSLWPLKWCSVPQSSYLRWLLASFPLWPGFEPRSGSAAFVVTEWQWGSFSPNISVSFANSLSTACFTLIFIYRTKWIQSHSTQRK